MKTVLIAVLCAGLIPVCVRANARFINPRHDGVCNVGVIQFAQGVAHTNFNVRVCTASAFMPLPNVKVKTVEAIMVEQQMMIDSFREAFPQLHVIGVQVDSALKGIWFFYDPITRR